MKQKEKKEQPSVAAEDLVNEDGEQMRVGGTEGAEDLVAEHANTRDAQLASNDLSEDESMRLFGGEQESAAKGSAASREPSLEEQLQAATALAEEHRNASLRAAAEMQNVRKRFERESKQARQYAVEGFARDLLMVADNLERALAAVPVECSPELKMFQDGVAMTQNELIRAFGKHGVTRLSVLNEPFDPNLHQAVLQVEEVTASPGTVVRELQSGYLLNGRLLRPAMVGVAKEMEETAQEAVDAVE